MTPFRSTIDGQKLPGISLIIPVYNANGYLREALDSVLAQTVKPRQIITVDDGSTDDSLEVARSYGDAITVIAQENQGTAAARNRGLEEASESMIALIDCDDRFVPTKLERQLHDLMTHPDTMLSICRVRAFWSPEVPDGDRRRSDLSPQFRPGQPGSWLARRELFDRTGGFSVEPDCHYIEGSELYQRIEHARCLVSQVDEVLLERRLSLSNKTANSKGHIDGIMTLMKRRLELRRRCI